jgi:4-hydroxy-3-methylbut-2-en-1-yl diphosphate reductase
MHQKKGLTSIIHGKYNHEETIATTSFCEDYICVKDMKEAQMVADYILNGGDKEAFMKHFANAHSPGFDPDIHLTKLGLANQTTMYKKETRGIGQLLQMTMMKKYGPVELGKHYIEFDTICDATQVSYTVEYNQTFSHDLYIFFSSFHLLITIFLYISLPKLSSGTTRCHP